MKKLITLLFILPFYVYAADLLMVIEKKAAKLNSCSKVQPCVITIDKKNNVYFVKVKQSALITEDGVMKYKTGSISYYKFNEKGEYLGVAHTT